MKKCKADIIIFDGAEYARYPHAKDWPSRNYYRARERFQKQGRSYYHIDLWESIHGEVPDGWHVHHKDGNPLNNSIDNLECLSPTAHVDAHRGNPIRRSPEWLEKLTKARVLSAEFAKTPAGRGVARQRAIRQAAARPSKEYVCEQCGVSFGAKSLRPARFCSGRCDARWRAANTPYVETRACVWCDSPFQASRHNKRHKACSISCGLRHSNAQKRAASTAPPTPPPAEAA